MATTKTAPKPKARAAEQPQRDPCLCGCGGFPMGRKSRFIPGHDARYHAALKRAADADKA